MKKQLTNSQSLFILMLMGASALSGAANAEDLSGAWRITFDTGRFGPMEARVVFTETADGVTGESQSGALEIIRTSPGGADRDFGDALLAISLTEDGEAYKGEARIADRDGEMTLTLAGDHIEGRIKASFVNGPFTGVRDDSEGALRDYPAILSGLGPVVTANIFNPKDLDSAGYKTFMARMADVAAAAQDDLDMVAGFYYGWNNDPFSHFDLSRTSLGAEAFMASLDDYKIGAPAARVTFDGDVAILDVDTMMGADTIDYINAAYDEIAAKGAKALIIDLRDNGGGAFAVKPLVEHVIDAPLDAGYFITQKWNAAHEGLPSRAEVEATAPWEGWSLVDFWRTLQEVPIMRIQFTPAEPNFNGPVFVVVNGETASAAEMTADALRSSGAATLIGSRTIGHLLSQSPFDVTDDYIISLPVADYYSLVHGRIEGAGVPPQTYAPSDMALGAAVAKAKEAIGSTE